MWPDIEQRWLEPTTPPEIAIASGRPPTAPTAPDLTYEDYKAQPPDVRLAGVQPSGMSPYEIQEYADTMAAQRKTRKAQRMQESYEKARAEGMVLPGETIDLAPTYRHTGMPPTRRDVSESIGFRRLMRGRISPEELAGRRQMLWRRRPSMLREAPDLEQDISRFAGMLPPDLQAERAKQQYRIEHPEVPVLPRYETTQTFKTPYGTFARKSITPPRLTTERQMYQTSEGDYRQGLFDESGNLIKDLGAATEKDIKGTAAVSITMGKPAAAAERTAIADKRAALDALDNLYSLYNEAYVGPITGRVAPTKGLMGLTSEQQENFMAATAAFVNALIKEITGAQMGEAEATRIKKQIPLITDPPTRWMAKYEQTRKNVEYVHQRYLEVLQQSGLKVPGGTDITIEEPFSEESLENMSDEELERIAGIR